MLVNTIQVQSTDYICAMGGRWLHVAGQEETLWGSAMLGLIDCTPSSMATPKNP